VSDANNGRKDPRCGSGSFRSHPKDFSSRHLPTGESMNPRFDVFRKQNDCLIKWVGTAESLEDLERLIRANSTNASPDFVIFRTANGFTEGFTKPLSEKKKSYESPS